MTKRKGELSNLMCDKAKPGLRPYSIFDHGGLYLLIMPTGGKLWRWAYRFEGKPRLMAFGKYPDVPLANARSYHADARKLLANGVERNGSHRGIGPRWNGLRRLSGTAVAYAQHSQSRSSR